MIHTRDQASLSIVSCGNTVTTLLTANPNRVAVTITPNKDHWLSVSDQSSFTISQGINIGPNNSPLQLTRESAGDWMSKQLFVIGDSTATTASVLEVICPCHVPPPSP